MGFPYPGVMGLWSTQVEIGWFLIGLVLLVAVLRLIGGIHDDEGSDSRGGASSDNNADSSVGRATNDAADFNSWNAHDHHHHHHDHGSNF